MAKAVVTFCALVKTPYYLACRQRRRNVDGERVKAAEVGRESMEDEGGLYRLQKVTKQFQAVRWSNALPRLDLTAAESIRKEGGLDSLRIAHNNSALCCL